MTETSTILDSEVGVIRYPDAEFISAARTDIPALLTEVARLRGIDEIYAEDVGKLERQNAGMTEQSERNYERYRKEKRDKARSESKLKTEIERLQMALEDMTSIALWSTRRLPKVHKAFAYDAIEANTGEEVERL